MAMVRLIALMLGLLPALTEGAATWALADAARDGDEALVQGLLDRGANPNSLDRSATPALVWATRRTGENSIKQLLGAGADPNLGDRNGVTALMWAAWNGDAAAVRTLLEAGADPLRRDAFGFDALWVGCYNSAGDADFAAALLAAGADPDSSGPHRMTPLMLAAEHGLGELIRVLIEGGATVGRVDDQQRNALHHALLQGHLPALPALLDAAEPAGLNQADRIGLTPLLIAVSRNDSALTDHLIAAGARVDGGGPSPLALSVAASQCRATLPEVLLRRGANPNGRDQHGRTGLLLAVGMGCQGLVARLIEAGADLDVSGPSGIGLVTAAIDSGQLRLARHLIQLGAPPDGRPDGGPDNSGPTTGSGGIPGRGPHNNPVGGLQSGGSDNASIIALLRRGRPAPVPLLEDLLKAGASADARDAQGTPALVLAAAAGDQPAVRRLAAVATDIDATDRRGRSALMVATRAGRRDLVEVLLAAHANPHLRDHLYARSAIDIARAAGDDAIGTLLEHPDRVTGSGPPDAGPNPPLTARAR